MAAPFLTDIDLGYNQLQRGRLHNLSADPSAPTTGQQGLALFRTDTKQARLWNGAAFDQLTGNVASVLGTAASGTVQGVTIGSAAAATGRLDQAVTISTTAATSGQAGSMSAADFTKLANATATNTSSTLVMRDASGNFAANSITATLVGTASNALTLGGHDSNFYLNFTNSSGTRDHNAISDFDTQVRTSRLDQMSVPTSAVVFNGQRATGLADPTSSQDAATKNYVDSVASGLDVKASVRATSTGNLVLSGAQTVDGVNLAVGDRVLVKNQTTASQNGLYVVATGAWGRTPDADNSAEVTPGMFTFVEEGSQGGSGWVLTTTGTITLGATSLAFTQFTGGSAYTAGNGLIQTGNSFAARAGATNSIVVSATGIDVATTYAGGANIVTVGIIGTGTWQGTPIGLAYGGTGTDASTAAGKATARNNLGATGKVSGTITGDGATTTFTFTHNMSQNHNLTMFDSAGNVVYADFALAATTDTIKVSTAIANGTSYTLVAEG